MLESRESTSAGIKHALLWFSEKERQQTMIDKDVDATGQYLTDIGSRPLLCAEEEQRMAMQIKAGNEDGRRQFIEANLKLVVSVANRTHGRGLPLEDIINEAMLGLL